MKYKVGDKVRIKDGISKKPNAIYCGWKTTIIQINPFNRTYKLELDNTVNDWTDDMFEDSLSDNAEKSATNEDLVKDIAEVIKKHNLGVSVSENDGKVIIEPLKPEEDLVKGAYVMVTNDIKNEAWTLRKYLANGYCDALRTDLFDLPPVKFKYIIPFDRFDPTNIEESLKYNIVK